MRFPEFLQEKGGIGFPAPSFGCAGEPYKSAFENALKKLSALGHAVYPGPNAFLDKGIGISNTPQECAAELQEMFASDRTDVLVSCGGGEMMCEDLDYVDFQELKELPAKWYMGYSDNTNLTFLLPTLCDTAAIYGPCAGAFGMEPWHRSIEDAYELLRGRKLTVENYGGYEGESLKDEDHPQAAYHITQDQQIRAFVPAGPEGSAARQAAKWEVAPDGTACMNGGRVRKNAGGLTEAAPGTELAFSGRLIGGCLDCLANLIGTEFDQAGAFGERYRQDGIIWFLESCDLNVFAIRRAIWEMKHGGGSGM